MAQGIKPPPALAAIGDSEAIKKAWDKVDPVVEKLEMPFFYLAGNHDIGSATTLNAWRDRMGSPSYHFLYKDVLFLSLFSEDPSFSHEGGLGDDQIQYFAQVLKENSSPRWRWYFYTSRSGR